MAVNTKAEHLWH